MQLKESDKKETEQLKAEKLPADRNDPFIYFARVIRGEIKMTPYDLSSPYNNEIVVKILEAAKVAARTGKTIRWNEYYQVGKKTGSQ